MTKYNAKITGPYHTPKYQNHVPPHTKIAPKYQNVIPLPTINEIILAKIASN